MPNNNMIQFFMNALRSGGNPQELAMNMLQQQNSPIGQNLINLVNQGDMKGLEQVARNLCQQRGLNFDSEFKAFKQQLGL